MTDLRHQEDQALLQHLLNNSLNEIFIKSNSVPLNFSTSEKVAVLLNVLDFQNEEIRRREGEEQKMFDWCTNLLLISFGAIVALSDRSTPIPYAIYVKSIASVLILTPTVAFSYRIFKQRRDFKSNTDIIEKIQNILHFFDEHYYHKDSLYPKRWAGRLTAKILKRRTPIYYSTILLLMAAGVIASIWLLL